MNTYKIYYFASKRGENPIKHFLDSLNPRTQAKILRYFYYIENLGLNNIFSRVKKLKNTPLWELRILGKDSVRIIYYIIGNQEILILHAFTKKTNKTPKKELKIALNRLKEYRLNID